MAAKLKWKGTSLFLGSFRVGEVRTLGKAWFRYRSPCDILQESREDYTEYADAQQDCESEVRRLLKEAGVELVD